MLVLSVQNFFIFLSSISFFWLLSLCASNLYALHIIFNCKTAWRRLKSTWRTQRGDGDYSIFVGYLFDFWLNFTSVGHFVCLRCAALCFAVVCCDVVCNFACYSIAITCIAHEQKKEKYSSLHGSLSSIRNAAASRCSINKPYLCAHLFFDISYSTTFFVLRTLRKRCNLTVEHNCCNSLFCYADFALRISVCNAYKIAWRTTQQQLQKTNSKHTEREREKL